MYSIEELKAQRDALLRRIDEIDLALAESTRDYHAHGRGMPIQQYSALKAEKVRLVIERKSVSALIKDVNRGAARQRDYVLADVLVRMLEERGMSELAALVRSQAGR